MKKNNRIQGIVPLAQTPFLNLYDVTYTNKVNALKHWTVASRRNQRHFSEKLLKQTHELQSDAVIIIAYHEEEEKLVLIKQFRVPINDYVYELPAGLVDANEAAFDSVKRELKEETGLELVRVDDRESYHHVYASAGMTDETLDMIVCTCKGTPSCAYLEEDEEIEVVMVTPQEAKQLLNDRPNIDVKALFVLKSFALVGKALFQNAK